MNFPYKMEIQPYTKKDSGYMWSKPWGPKFEHRIHE
jgi:hypothetical protein